MFFKKTVFVLALVGATIPVAFANSGSTPVGGEKGFETHKMPITQSRAEVKKEAQAVRNHLATAHGVTQVNSEAGNALTQHSHSLPLRQNSCRPNRSKNLGAAMKDANGTIRTDIQRQSGSATATARERHSGSGSPGSRHWSGNTAALA